MVVPSLSQGAQRTLSLHTWPGNVRELRNIVERLCALSDGPEIHVQPTHALAGLWRR